MEDAHVVHNGPPQCKEPCMFGVFDGHGGDECARFLSQNLCTAVASHPAFLEDPRRAIEESFLQVDSQYVQLARQLELEDGSTGTLLLLQIDVCAPDQPLHFYLAGSGDSRAVMIKKNGQVECLVEDHNPSREDERARIKRDGGEVLYDIDNEIFRVTSEEGGGLAVTRAFGDYHFKPYVTAKPEIVDGIVHDDHLYICIASDGLWGDLENDEVARALVEKGAKQGVEYSMEEAFSRGSDDNITMIVVDLHVARQRLFADVKNRSIALSPKAVTAADEGAGPRAVGMHTPQTPSMRDSVRVSVEDPLLLAVARKISTASAMLSNDVDDVKIPGISVQFSNDLVLWRDIPRSFLWFTMINAMFYFNIFHEVHTLRLISMVLLLRLVGAFFLARVASFLRMVGILQEGSDDLLSNIPNYVMTSETVTFFANAIVGTLSPFLNQYNDLVVRGSATSVLLTLRTITYFYTPIPISYITWLAFVVIFTVPAIYARHKESIDAQYESQVAWATTVTQPYIDQARTHLKQAETLKERYFGKKDPDEGAGPIKSTKKIGDLIGTEISDEL